MQPVICASHTLDVQHSASTANCWSSSFDAAKTDVSNRSHSVFVKAFAQSQLLAIALAPPCLALHSVSSTQVIAFSLDLRLSPPCARH
eukprot:226383-Pyramimonas_sp.AAC.1